MDNPSINWQNISGENCLKFTFDGRLTKDNAVAAIAEWRNAFDQYPDKKIIVIWDCMKMSGYDSDARTEWQLVLKEMKARIEKIFLITDSSLIKMGASVMSVFASYSIDVVSEEKEIKIK